MSIAALGSMSKTNPYHVWFSHGCAISVMACAIGGPAQAAAVADPWSLSLGLGGEYNTSISVEALDTRRKTGDFAANLSAAVGYTVSKAPKASLRLSYGLDQSLHKAAPAYDLLTQSFGVAAGTRLGKADLGLDYQAYTMRLGSKPFLDMQVLTPSVSGFIRPHLWLRGGYGYAQKSFATAQTTNAKTLDANTQSVTADAYYLLPRHKAYLGLGARYELEDAVNPALSFQAYQLSAKAQMRAKLLGRPAKFALAYQYRARDYDAITPAIGQTRQERRSSYTASAELALTPTLTAKPQFRHTARISNYRPADYEENLVSFMLVYRLR